MGAPYFVSFEVEGPAAMFTRPDTGAAPISYPVPTFSAAKGMFEAVARLRTAYIRPIRIEVCRPIRYMRWTTNYGGPLRKPQQIVNGNSYQLIATVLADVCYKVHGIAEAAEGSPGAHDHRHFLADRFTRRLRRGETWYTPCLGWKEFAPTYFGPLRADTCANRDVNLIIPSLLHAMYDRPSGGALRPTFRQNVDLREGVLSYEDGSAAPC